MTIYCLARLMKRKTMNKTGIADINKIYVAIITYSVISFIFFFSFGKHLKRTETPRVYPSSDEL